MTATAPAQEGKTCTKCGVWKGFGEFSGRKAARCLVCKASYKREWAAANADRIAARKAELWAANLEANKAKQRARYKSDPERAKARAKDWAAANPEKRKAIANRCAAKRYRDPVQRPKIEAGKNPVKQRERARRCVARLTDNYVRGLVTQHTNLARKDIPPELVKFKRDQLRLHRLSRDLKKAIKENLE